MLALGPDALAEPEARDHLIVEETTDLDAIDRLGSAIPDDGDPVVVVPDAAVTADRLVEVLSKPLSWASTYTLAGAAGGRLRAAYVQDQVCAGEIGVTVGAGTAWLAAGGACDRPASELVPALREASAACEARWAEVPADRRCLAVRPFLGPGATAADLLRVLGDLHGAGEAVRFAYDPLGRTFRQCDPSAPAPKPEEYCR